MANFDTHSRDATAKPSHCEIQEFAILLKVRFGEKATHTAAYFAQEHEKTGDFTRAQMWHSVASSLKLNDFASAQQANTVNRLH